MIKIQKYLPISKRRSGLKNNGIKFLVAHDTGNPNSTAMSNVEHYIKSSNEMEASAHVFIDDKEIIECIPLDEKAWHVRYLGPEDNERFGIDANDFALGIELCYGKNINNLKAYKNYCKYIAMLCQKYDLDPLTKIAGHFQLDPGRKTDPIDAFNLINKTWEQFLKDVKKETRKKK